MKLMADLLAQFHDLPVFYVLYQSAAYGGLVPPLGFVLTDVT